MQKKFVASELKKYADSHPPQERGWYYLFGFASKLLSLINDANGLNCDPRHIDELSRELLEFQYSILETLMALDFREKLIEPHFRAAVINLNRLKNRFLKVCPD